MKPGWMKAATALGLAGAAAFMVYGWRSGIFSSREAMEAFLEPFGPGAPVMFILIQIIQVVIPILPGGISCLGGVVLFGPVWGFIYNYAGICVGSLLAFLLARQYGRPLVESMVSRSACEKYGRWLDNGKKFDRFFAAAIFFPVAPDDLLCYLAGLTKMSVKKFTAIIVLGKPASIALYSMGLMLVTRRWAGCYKGKGAADESSSVYRRQKCGEAKRRGNGPVPSGAGAGHGGCGLYGESPGGLRPGAYQYRAAGRQMDGGKGPAGKGKRWCGTAIPPWRIFGGPLWDPTRRRLCLKNGLKAATAARIWC